MHKRLPIETETVGRHRGIVAIGDKVGLRDYIGRFRGLYVGIGV